MIEWEVRKYYWKLYVKHEAKVNKEEILKNIDNLTKIKLEDCRKLKCEITEGEVTVTLKNTKNSMAPSRGSFGGSFYKVFWKYLKKIVVGAIGEIYRNRELPLSQRLGIIVLILKRDKDQWFISNWQPLTLLETFYKLISATLAARLKPILDKII